MVKTWWPGVDKLFGGHQIQFWIQNCMIHVCPIFIQILSGPNLFHFHKVFFKHIMSSGVGREPKYRWNKNEWINSNASDGNVYFNSIISIVLLYIFILSTMPNDTMLLITAIAMYAFGFFLWNIDNWYCSHLRFVTKLSNLYAFYYDSHFSISLIDLFCVVVSVKKKNW